MSSSTDDRQLIVTSNEVWSADELSSTELWSADAESSTEFDISRKLKDASDYTNDVGF